MLANRRKFKGSEMVDFAAMWIEQPIDLREKNMPQSQPDSSKSSKGAPRERRKYLAYFLNTEIRTSLQKRGRVVESSRGGWLPPLRPANKIRDWRPGKQRGDPASATSLGFDLGDLITMYYAQHGCRFGDDGVLSIVYDGKCAL
jgi:hypothetical protein